MIHGRHLALLLITAMLLCCSDDDPAAPTGGSGGAAGDLGSGGTSVGGNDGGAAGACPTGSCTCNSSADCADDEWCDTSGEAGVCTPKKNNGEACSKFKSCLSGYCVDDVCCETACNEVCSACTNAKTGAANGSCAPVSSATDPDDECGQWLCDGAGQCAVCGDGVVQATESCDDYNQDACGSCNASCSGAGTGPPCGTHAWSKQFGDGADQVGRAIANDAQGNVLLTGALEGSADFGGGTLTSAGGTDAFVVKLDANGNHLWSKRFGDGAEQEGRAIAVDAAGNVLVAGNFSGSADFGGGALTSAGATDLFVVKLDGSGNHVWSKRFGDDKAQDLSGGMVVDAASNVLIGGDFRGALDFGGGALTSAGGHDLFMAKLGSDGQHVWSKRFGDGSDQYAKALGKDNSGAPIITGIFVGNLDFGGTVLNNPSGWVIYAAKLGADGGHLWSKRFGNATPQGVAGDASGGTFIVGDFKDNTQFGGNTLNSAGSYDIFVVKLDANGAHLWSKSFGDPDSQLAHDIAVDTKGNATFVGKLSGSVDFGGGTLDGNVSDIFVAKLQTSGGYLWSRRFAASMSQQALGVTSDNQDNVLFTGRAKGSVDFGGGLLSSGGKEDVFVVKLAP